jgi:hypothetical protein
MSKNSREWLRYAALIGALAVLVRSGFRRHRSDLFWTAFAFALGCSVLAQRFGSFRKRAGEITQAPAASADLVDLGSELSFPASDPPAY